MNRPVGQGSTQACAACRRPLPAAEQMVGDLCRICAKLKYPNARFEKAVLPTPDTTPLSWKQCHKCKGPKKVSRNNPYCAPCWRGYKRGLRIRKGLPVRGVPVRMPVKRTKLVRTLGKREYRIAKARSESSGFAIRSNPLMFGPTLEFPGVDIDAIHYKRGMVKVKKAA